MSWLNSFDPAAPRASSSKGSSRAPSYVGSYPNDESQRRIQGTPNAAAGPSKVRSNTAVTQQPARQPPQTGRTTRLYQPPSSAASSSAVFVPRPTRPPHRIKAAPPSAALRSEDAQPNENEARTKPWEIAAPPSIGKAKSSQSMRPPRLPTRPRALQQTPASVARAPLPTGSSAFRPPSNRPLPSRPSQHQVERQPPMQIQPQTHLQPRPASQPQTNPPQSRPQSQPQPPSAPKKPKPPPKDSKTQRRKRKEKAKKAKKWRKEQQKLLEEQQKQQEGGLASQGSKKDDERPSKRTKLDDTEARSSNAALVRTHLEASRSGAARYEPQSSEGIRTPSPPPALVKTSPNAVKPDSGHQSNGSTSPSTKLPNLAQLRGILSLVNKSPEAAKTSKSCPKQEDPQEAAREVEAARRAEEARQAEELARYLDQLPDEDSVDSSHVEPSARKVVAEQGFETSGSASKALEKAVKAEDHEQDELPDETSHGLQPTFTGQRPVEVSDDDDEDDRPLAAGLQATRREELLSNLACRRQHPDHADSDPDEDVPLQDLLQRRSSDAPSSANSIDKGSKWPAKAFQPKVTRVFSGAHNLSIKFYVPLASSALEARARAPVRNRAAAFDATIGVSENGRIVTFSEERINRSPGSVKDLPSKMMQFQAQDLEKNVKGERSSSPIDRVEDVSRLTSKVCGIASSTRKPLGLKNHEDYPCQVSLVTVDGTGRAHRTYHLEERPHAWGVASISHFPRTDPEDASSIDFATGGIDGTVNHWHWKARSITAETFRLHTLHDSKPVVALEHLSSRSNVLASASIGSVVGFDLAALTLGFSWNTSDHIVHLERTPDPRLMLGVLARRDYDQFRMFDITGRNGPISRPVISFGWLNDSQGTLPLGRGSFHPTRRAIFAHGGEDGRVRVWDIRNARDPLIDERLADSPIVETVWGSGEKGQGDEEDLLYVATPRGVGSISLLAP